ncbi:hypothetical protein [[Phormidium] sp. ETS-05]|uniref:hypothetical protein n=1 Tax=[Phormidium] sp. ETS-05 TaxID=222819 RepID=UPI0018EF2B9E|nr:hypothetical protein [[Phormidium] sp. ETS-05]
MTDDELRKLVESNAGTAQAMLDSMAAARMEREQFREGMTQFPKTLDRLLVLLGERINHLVSFLEKKDLIKNFLKPPNGCRLGCHNI